MQERNVIQQINSPLFEVKGWIKLIGIVTIIYGVLLIFTLVGIIICWLPIWLGYLLIKASDAVEAAHMSGDKYRLIEALGRLKTYFQIYGVLILIGLIGMGISLLISGGAFLSMLSRM